MSRRLLPAALAALVLAGCATAPRSPGTWVAGRMSVEVHPADAPARRVASAFELQGDGERGELRLTSPLGSVVAAARWAPGEAVLTTADGETRYGGLDELSQQALGETLPLAALPDWLAGRPWSGAPHAATARGFEQLGWNVDLARRDEGWIEAARAAPPPMQVRVRLEAPG
ncbi:outer membrane lipoprotein LolB [Rubrivivax gelatinosus]|nr:outer membrane lipoprotein LolB [Rubrivivax gelatinosus]